MSHIEISNRIIDKRYRVRRVGKQKCSNCHNPSRLLYDYENLPHSICELCNTVFRYSSRTMKSGVICHTNLTQLEIIRKTYEFLKKNTRIPRISEVDSDARRCGANRIRGRLPTLTRFQERHLREDGFSEERIR